MRLEEAIKELAFWEERFHDYNDPQMTKAVRLGIEALKAVQQSRAQQGLWILGLLPGETEE